MSFDFPNSPTNGQVFAPSGGPVYVYTGGVWRMQGSGQVVTAETRNRIVNGAMQISQEYGNSPIGGGYPADQMLIAGAFTPGNYGSQRVQVTTPNGSTNRVRITISTAKPTLAAGDVLLIQQPIEGIRTADFRWGTASAKQVVVRFGFKAPAGTYSVRLGNGAANRSYIVNFTISAGQANTDTEQVLVVPGDTTGTWTVDSTLGVNLTVAILSGTNNVGVVGWQAGDKLATASNTNGAATTSVYELYDVGLYLDPNATGVPPPWVMPDEAQELAACQRYWEPVGITAVTAPNYSAAFYKATKRVAPAFASSVNMNGATVTVIPAGPTGGFRQVNAAASAVDVAIYCNSRM